MAEKAGLAQVTDAKRVLSKPHLSNTVKHTNSGLRMVYHNKLQDWTKILFVLYFLEWFQIHPSWTQAFKDYHLKHEF